MRLRRGKKGQKLEEEEKFIDVASNINERSLNESSSRETDRNVNAVAYSNGVQPDLWSHSQLRHNPENDFAPEVEQSRKISRKPLPAPEHYTPENVGIEDDKPDSMPPRRSISISRQDGTPPKADVHGKRQRPLPALPASDIHRSGGVIPPNANQGYGLWRFIGHIPQSSDDQRLMVELRQTFTLVDQHVDNFYTDKANQDLPKLRHLDKMEFPNLPIESSLADVFCEVAHPTTVIKHSLLMILLSTIEFDCNSPFPSLLPDEFTALPYASKSSTARDGEVAHAMAAAAATRVLTYYLRQDLRNDKNHIKFQEKAIDELAPLIEFVFSPWLADDKEEQDRLLNLAKLLQNTAKLGILLYSQASTFFFDWKAQYSSNSVNMVIPISPRVFKITDENAQLINPPQLMLHQRKETTWYLDDATAQYGVDASVSGGDLPLSVEMLQHKDRTNSSSSNPPLMMEDRFIPSSVRVPQNTNRYMRTHTTTSNNVNEIQSHAKILLNEFRHSSSNTASAQRPPTANRGQRKVVDPHTSTRNPVEIGSSQVPIQSQSSEKSAGEGAENLINDFADFHIETQLLDARTSSNGVMRNANPRLPPDLSNTSNEQSRSFASRAGIEELPASSPIDPKSQNQTQTHASHMAPQYDNIPQELPARSSTDTNPSRESGRSRNSPQRKAGDPPTAWRGIGKSGSGDVSTQRNESHRSRSRSRTSSVSSDNRIPMKRYTEDINGQSNRFRSSSLGRSGSTGSRSGRTLFGSIKNKILG